MGDTKQHQSVTIVVNVYNAADIIDDFMGSLTEQTFTDFHLLVIDDGSTDHTIQKIEKYNEQIDISIHRRSHQGIKKARAYGVQQASGDIIIILDADLILDCHAIEELVRPLETDTVGAVGGTLKGKGDTTTSKAYGFLRELFYSLRAKGQQADWLTGGFAAFKQEVIKKAGGFSTEQLSGDLDISWKIKKQGYRLVLNQDAVAYHRDPETLQEIWNREKNIGQREYHLTKKHPKEAMKPRRLFRFYPMLLPVAILLTFLSWPLVATIIAISYLATLIAVKGTFKVRSIAWLVFNVMNAAYCTGFLSTMLINKK